MHFDPTSEMKELAYLCFGYQGKKYQVEIADKYSPQLYWDGGSKKDCRLICREGLKIIPPVPTTGNIFYDAVRSELIIPANHFILEHNIFCGKDMGIKFVIRPDEADTNMLPVSNEELSKHEKIVMLATITFKSSFRFVEANEETGIKLKEYENAKQSLIERGYLNKAGAATVKGKNCINQLPHPLSMLK